MSTIHKHMLSIGLIFISLAAMAQPPPPPATPIDGGLSLLLAAGGLYGLKKLRDRKNHAD
ncbi:MAG: hypothetical protein AAF789_01005 [Bacteroidota bacterium]